MEYDMLIVVLFMIVVRAQVHLTAATSHRQVIGFLHLSFDPPSLQIQQGQELLGIANFTVPDVSFLHNQLRLHVCCHDQNKAIILEPSGSFIAEIHNQTTMFQVRIHGGHIGTTRLKFYITKNSTWSLTTSLTTSSTTTDKTTTHQSVRSFQPVQYPSTTLPTTTSFPLWNTPKLGHLEDPNQASTQSTLTSSSITITTTTVKSIHQDLTSSTTEPADDKPKHAEDKFPVNNPIFQDFDYDDSYYEVLPPIRNPNADSKDPTSQKSKDIPNAEDVPKPRKVRTSRAAGKSGSRLLTKEEYMKRKKMEELGIDSLGSTSTTSPSTVKFFNPEDTENQEDIWWLPQEYPVLVLSPPAPHSYYVQFFVFLLELVLLFACAGQMAMHELLYLLKHPLILFVAAVARFIVMPGLTIGLVELLHPAHASSLGMLALSCTSSDGASVLVLLLLEADLSLALAVLVCNSILSLGMLPLWSVIFQHLVYQHPDAHVVLPFTEMFLMTSMALLSIVFGITFQRKLPKLYNKLWDVAAIPAGVVLLLKCCLEFYRNHFIFNLLTVNVFFMAALLASAGFLFGAAVAFITRLPASRILVIAVETGTHTSFLSCLLLGSTLPQPDADIAKAGPTLWSILTLVPALLCSCTVRMYMRYGRRRYAATECTDLDDESLMPEEEDNMIVVEEKETAI